MADLEKLSEEISKLTLLEASTLVKMLEEKLGVSAAAPVAMAMMPAAGPAAAEAAPEEEKTEFTVILKDVGDKKIEVIKAVRKLTNLGLKEAKDLVEAVPATVLEAVAKEAAENARAELQGAGATVEIK